MDIMQYIAADRGNALILEKKYNITPDFIEQCRQAQDVLTRFFPQKSDTTAADAASDEKTSTSTTQRNFPELHSYLTNRLCKLTNVNDDDQSLVAEINLQFAEKRGMKSRIKQIIIFLCAIVISGIFMYFLHYISRVIIITIVLLTLWALMFMVFGACTRGISDILFPFFICYVIFNADGRKEVYDIYSMVYKDCGGLVSAIGWCAAALITGGVWVVRNDAKREPIAKNLEKLSKAYQHRFYELQNAPEID